jgi:thioredoxin-related protein
MKKILILLLLPFLFSLAACSSSSVSSIESSNAINSESINMITNQSKLLFFWLPTGAPCQEQNMILKSFISDYPNISLEYIDATDENARDKFYKYGVRSLPSLVLLDESGEITKQFIPGIHSEEEIVDEISKL